MRAAAREHPGSTGGVHEGPGALAGLLLRRPDGDRTEIARCSSTTLSRRGARGVDGLPGRRGRWRAATRARSGAGSTRPGSGSRSASSSSCRSSTAATRWRCCHLDLLVLTGFSVSRSPSSTTRASDSSVAARPPAARLPPRPHAADRLRRAGPAPSRRGRCALLVPVAWLAIAAVFLVGFRIGLNVDRLQRHRRRLRGRHRRRPPHARRAALRRLPDDNEHGDTYGPVTYAGLRPVRAGAAVERDLGRPAGGARRGARVRPAVRRAAVPARTAHPRADARASCSPTRGWRSRSRSSSRTRTPTTRSSPRSCSRALLVAGDPAARGAPRSRSPG